MHDVVIAVFAFFTLLAQARPDGETLMERMAESAVKRQSMEYVMDTTVEATQGGQRVDSQSAVGRISVAFVNPAKLRIEEQLKIGTRTTQSLIVSDGEFTWTYNPAAKQHTKTAVGQRLTALGLPANVVGLPVSDVQGSPRLVREEAIEVDGQKHDCWIVFDVLKVPASRAAQTSNAVMTSWIDKEQMVALKHEASLSLTPTPPPGQATPPSLDLKVTMVMRSLKLDESISADTFVFTPPPDSKEVPYLNAGVQPDRTGTVAPAFEGKDLDGKSYSLDSLRGKPVLLDFWATWCKPCADSVPALERIAADFQGKGLVMLAIDVGEDRRVVEAYLKPRPMPYPVIIGSEFGLERAFQIGPIPTFILIDTDGKIAAQQVGYGSGGEALLRGMLAKVGLGSPPPAPGGATTSAAVPRSVDTAPAAPATVRYNPGAVAVDANGSLFIADFGGARVIKVTPGGPSVVVAGTGAPGSGGDGGPAIFVPLNQPAALAVDTPGNLYIAETGGGRVRRVKSDGTIATVDGATQLQRVGGIALDAAGNLYVSEPGAHRVQKVTPDGQVSTVAGIGTPGSRGDGGPATAAQLAAPSGLAMDANGTLYIADTGNHRVRKVTTDGVITLAAGNGSSGSSGDGGLAVLAQLKNPTGLAVDAAGNLYISDSGDYRIRKVTPNGTITTFAGTGTAGLAGDDGPAIRAQFSAAPSLAIDKEGNLYVADAANRRIRKISTDGAITTVPGTVVEDKQ